MGLCARSGCIEIGTKDCAACLKESYCSGECQLEDWKAHRILCKFIKSMPLSPYLSYVNLSLVFQKIRCLSEVQKAKLGKKKYIALLEHTLVFHEHQFGKKEYSMYRRDNGELNNIDFYLSGVNTIIYSKLSIKAIEEIDGRFKYMHEIKCSQ